MRTLARYLAPVLAAMEWATRPRLAAFVRHERWLGLICLFLAILLLLPLPFFNIAPALCLVAIALGMVHRDGLLVALGLVGTIVLAFSLGFAVRWMVNLFAEG